MNRLKKDKQWYQSRDEIEKVIKRPHDAAFRLAFRKQEVAGAFFRSYLPEQVSRHLDLKHLQLNNYRFVDEGFSACPISSRSIENVCQ